MKKIPIVFLFVALASLACLSTAEPFATYPADTPTAAAVVVTDQAVEISPTPDATITAEPRMCARVIALDALHLRKGPSEKDIVLSWLLRNDIVVVVDQVNPEWWHIESALYSGYARAIYLQESECE